MQKVKVETSYRNKSRHFLEHVLQMYI